MRSVIARIYFFQIKTRQAVFFQLRLFISRAGHDTASYFKGFLGSTLVLLQLAKFKIGIQLMKCESKEHQVQTAELFQSFISHLKVALE